MVNYHQLNPMALIDGKLSPIDVMALIDVKLSRIGSNGSNRW